jgi:hypothetical protein
MDVVVDRHLMMSQEKIGAAIGTIQRIKPNCKAYRFTPPVPQVHSQV